MRDRPILPTRPRVVPAPFCVPGGATTIPSLLGERVARSPDAAALVDAGETLTYAELEDRVARTAAWLEDHGVVPGSSVMVQMPNWWETIVVFHAVARIGAVVNPIVPIYRQSELRFILEQSRPAAIVVPGVFRGFDHPAMFEELLGGCAVAQGPARLVVRPHGGTPTAGWADFGSIDTEGSGPQRAPARDDIALLLYTSGTTAAPKGVLHSHATLLSETQSMVEWYELGVDDPIFMGSPLTHITGFLYAFVLPLITGATTALLDVWQGTAGADLIERTGCRFTVAATPFLRDLRDEYASRGSASSLRVFACGGADVPPALVRDAERVLGASVSRVYGSSEFPTVTCGRVSDSVEDRATTDGVPLGGIELRLESVDAHGVGELVANGPELFLGYLDAELNIDSFTDDGWFRTGDLASIDEAGRVAIRGRSKDIIIRNGENVSAREVEDVLFAHPAIRDVAVIALPDERTGERACAVVVSVDGAQVTLDDIQSYLASAQLAKAKWPEQVEVVTELPRTASGKVQKFLLRASLAGA